MIPMRTLTLATALLLVAACSGPELVVKSDTDWSGFIGGDAGNSVDGRGNWTFELNDGLTCWTFQKETAGGTLRVYSQTKGIFGRDRSGDATTTAEFGIVTGCSE